MNLMLFDIKTGKEIVEGDEIIKLSDLETKQEYEAWGLQNDGQPVVFDRCGNYGYIDPNAVRVCMDFN